MTDLKQVRAFAIKWREKFLNTNISHEEISGKPFGNECEKLGFDLNSGSAFFEKFSSVINQWDDLKAIIDKLFDIRLLGSLLYSRWKFFNNWESLSYEILEKENIDWFILIFDRIIALTNETKRFYGELKLIRLVSNNIRTGPAVQSDIDTEQRLKISNDGSIVFSSYALSIPEYKLKRKRGRRFRIDADVKNRLFDAISSYFKAGYIESYIPNTGNWILELINDVDECFEYKGSFLDLIANDGINLSTLIRKSTGLESIFAFDGKTEADVIKKITIEYSKERIIDTLTKANMVFNLTSLELSEILIIDSEANTIEYFKSNNLGAKVSFRYEIDSGLSRLLDKFNPDELFMNIEGNPVDAVVGKEEVRGYKITVEFDKNNKRVIEGSYDKKGLPDDFESFMKMILDYIWFHGYGELFDSGIYTKPVRRKDEYIYCSVVFSHGYQSYYYLTDDDSIRVGDFVLVQSGLENKETIVQVVNIEYFTKDKVPYPLEHIKKIISKF